MKTITIETTTGRSGTPEYRSVTSTASVPETIEEVFDLFEGGLIYETFMKEYLIQLRAPIRSALEAGRSPAEIQKLVNDFKLGAGTRQVDLEKLEARLRKLQATATKHGIKL